jgi:hypothetical protein
MKLASAKPSTKGFVLDYVQFTSNVTNWTFQGDTTYYVSGAYDLSGVTTFEGGTVIKMNGDGYARLGARDQDNLRLQHG